MHTMKAFTAAALLSLCSGPAAFPQLPAVPAPIAAYIPASGSTPQVEIVKELSYKEHTLEDTYSYRDTERSFQWDKMTEWLNALETVQNGHVTWVTLQNYKNDTTLEKPVRYGRDGALFMLLQDSADYVQACSVLYDGAWYVPKDYVEVLPVHRFSKVIFVDRTNQNIATLEKGDGNTWYVRSMNPATTGLHNPPSQQETPASLLGPAASPAAATSTASPSITPRPPRKTTSSSPPRWVLRPVRTCVCAMPPPMRSSSTTGRHRSKPW